MSSDRSRLRAIRAMGVTAVVESVLLGPDDPTDRVANHYHQRRAVSVDVSLLTDRDRAWCAAELYALAIDDGGFVWQVDEHAWLIAPPGAVPPAGGPPTSGDRVPRNPRGPVQSGAIALPADS